MDAVSADGKVFFFFFIFGNLVFENAEGEGMMIIDKDDFKFRGKVTSHKGRRFKTKE